MILSMLQIPLWDKAQGKDPFQSGIPLPYRVWHSPQDVMRLTGVSWKVAGSGPMTFLSGLNTVYTKGGLTSCIHSGLAIGQTISGKLTLREKSPDEIGRSKPRPNSVNLSWKIKSTGCPRRQWYSDLSWRTLISASQGQEEKRQRWPRMLSKLLCSTPCGLPINNNEKENWCAGNHDSLEFGL